jgi:hypothetical protein
MGIFGILTYVAVSMILDRVSEDEWILGFQIFSIGMRYQTVENNFRTMRSAGLF